MRKLLTRPLLTQAILAQHRFVEQCSATDSEKAPMHAVLNSLVNALSWEVGEMPDAVFRYVDEAERLKESK